MIFMQFHAAVSRDQLQIAGPVLFLFSILSRVRYINEQRKFASLSFQDKIIFVSYRMDRVRFCT